jgi:outer membrane receptor for Fe3+-dicitrate
MEPPDETCCMPLENSLKMCSTTEGHDDQNGEWMESSRATENPAEIIVSKLNNKTDTGKSQISFNSKTRNKADSITTVTSSNRSQTVQNLSKPSVTSTNAKQMESH